MPQIAIAISLDPPTQDAGSSPPGFSYIFRIGISTVQPATIASWVGGGSRSTWEMKKSLVV